MARLKQEYTRLKKDPIPYIVAEPLPSKIHWNSITQSEILKTVFTKMEYITTS